MFYTMVAGWMVYYVYVMGSGQLHGGSVEAIEDKFTGMLASPGLMVAITLAVIVCCIGTVSYTHLRAHETDSYLVCRLLLEKKKKWKMC